MGALNPSFLMNQIDLIGQIISVMILVVFDDFFTERITFKGIDWLKKKVLEKAKEKMSKKRTIIVKYLFNLLATFLFIGYFFIGYWILSEYVIVPILIRAQGILLIILIILFLIMSWMLNNRKVRKKYLGYK